MIVPVLCRYLPGFIFYSVSSATMGRDPKKKRLELLMTEDEIKALAAHATAEGRSTKNMAEWIIKKFLDSIKKKKA